jgi:hypothetical protein
MSKPPEDRRGSLVNYSLIFICLIKGRFMLQIGKMHTGGRLLCCFRCVAWSIYEISCP